MGRPCFTFYLRPQIIQAVEDDPSDRDQFVNAAAVLALRPKRVSRQRVSRRAFVFSSFGTVV